MPYTPHVEHHFRAGLVVRDMVIGLSDGLTVPFALAAGLSGAVDSTALIVTAGLAEIAAGSIAMGLGGYLAAKSDADHYASERRRERVEIGQKPLEEMAEVATVFESYGLTTEEAGMIARVLATRPDAWVDFMMRFELGLETPDPKRALTSALTIGGAYALRPIGTPHRDARPPCPPASADRSILGHSLETLPLRAARVATATPPRSRRAARLSSTSAPCPPRAPARASRRLARSSRRWSPRGTRSPLQAASIASS